ncbi:AAA family ATPase [Microbacterium lacticum]|uniref:AAA family ATPase n=1 Tax=Microbacterium lacticum TaxID=33885 RepID=UPI001F55EC37|nr:AAA family ATPase [Microbacterium lacticum]
MTNLTETREVLKNYLKARIPLVVIRSMERNRCADVLASLAGEFRQMPFYIHTRTEGLKQLSDGMLVSEDASLPAAIDYATNLIKRTEYVNFVFTDVEELDDESPTSRHFAELARLAEAHAGTIIVLSEKPVWTGLGRLGMSVTLDLPDADEMYSVIAGLVDQYRGQVQIDWDAEDVRAAAGILSGVTETEAMNVLASLIAGGTLTRDKLRELSEYKDRIFGDLAGIERIRLSEDYRVGGLKNLRTWLSKRERLMIADYSHTKVSPPRGVLLVGVPGCGKSLSAKAIASDWNLPLYRLDMAAVLGMYVGQSESRLREALETADRVAPCVLWIDEIEKALASGGDGGTSRRLIGQFLFWLQESTSRVFMVATANDISSLPPELTRKGRFDEIFFVDLPDPADRAEILRMYFTSICNFDLPPDLEGLLVQATDSFSGAEIRAVVDEIGLTMYADDRRAMYDDATLLQFFSNTIPFAHSNAEDLDEIRAWGRTRAVPAGTEQLYDATPRGTTVPGRRIVMT